jgi:uncharacterized membrane protein
MYLAWKFVHIAGVVLLVGNVTITAIWKVFADRTGEPRTIAFAQRMVNGTDWVCTGGGILLIVAGGYGMAASAGLNLATTRWLLWGQILFVVSGILWLAVLVPIQIRQAQLAAGFADDGAIPRDYRDLSARWLIWGIAATVPLVAALFVMIVKP